MFGGSIDHAVQPLEELDAELIYVDDIAEQVGHIGVGQIESRLDCFRFQQLVGIFKTHYGSSIQLHCERVSHGERVCVCIGECACGGGYSL